MKKILLIGGGTHFNSCIDVINSQKKFKILGFVDKKNIFLKRKIKWLGTDKNLKFLRKKVSNVLIAIGQIRDLDIREKLFNKLSKLKYKFPVIISKNTYISNLSKIGIGSIVMHGSIINSNVKIGKNCIINTGSIIEHDVEIGDHCHISTGAIINGGTKIGNNTFIGSGSVIKQNINIGSKCFINANLFISKNLKKNKIIK